MSNRNERNRLRRKRQRVKRNKRNILLLTIAMSVISASILFNGFKIKQDTVAYAAIEKELKIRLDEEKERTKEAKRYAEYVKTDDYVEEVAHDKLGLAYPDEIIFQASE